jgi:glycosyltransferase involved in cell wall biosynthesis
LSAFPDLEAQCLELTTILELSKPEKILFLVPYPLNTAPSQRFRFEQYFAALQNKGTTVDVQSFFTSQNWQLFFKTGHMLAKAAGIASGIIRRLSVLFHARSYDFVFIHREVCPIGPPLFEWFIASVLKRKIIYDFDDAIWMTDRKNENALITLIRWRHKVATICRRSYKVSCGNQFLCDYAASYSNTVVFIPTTVDTEHMHNKQKAHEEKSPVVIGWTGTHSTLKYLDLVTPILSSIKAEYNVELRIIADRSPDLSVPIVFYPWKKSSEIEDLLAFDIGIMPLPDDIWSKGKCGFKAIQYLALGIPAVVSDVGVNSSVVQHGITGYCCRNDHEWRDALVKLIVNTSMRKQMGNAGRKHVESNYSVNSNLSAFTSLFA